MFSCLALCLFARVGWYVLNIYSDEWPDEDVLKLDAFSEDAVYLGRCFWNVIKKFVDCFGYLMLLAAAATLVVCRGAEDSQIQCLRYLAKPDVCERALLCAIALHIQWVCESDFASRLSLCIGVLSGFSGAKSKDKGTAPSHCGLMSEKLSLVAIIIEQGNGLV